MKRGVPERLCKAMRSLCDLFVIATSDTFSGHAIPVFKGQDTSVAV